MLPKRRNKIYVAAAVLFAAVLLITVFQLCGHAEFDATRWKLNREQSSKAVRYAMSKAVVTYLNSNKPTRDEVLDLLGPPDRKAKDVFYQYDLGSNSSIPFSPINQQWWLTIGFKSGRVSEVMRNPD